MNVLIKPHQNGLVVGKFAPLHKGHQYLLERALAGCQNLTILVYSNPDFEEMPSSVRANWLRTLYPSARVYVPENPPANDADDFTQRECVKNWLEQNNIPVDVVFTSEHYGAGFAQHLGTEHVLVDLERHKFPISGTQLRQNIHASRAWLDGVVYSHFVPKVVFMGAESTGKSTLTERMALELHTSFVPEYGRTHYEERGGILELEDYVHIALHHRKLEDQAILEANRFLMVDTNAITTLFFSYYYNRGGLPQLHHLADDCKKRYSQVFVCDDDIPFEQDGWRDNAVWRGRMQGMILYDLERRGIGYTVVSGTLEQRVARVKSVLDL
jgi:HTH-type transcriptional regulator, transcriptional repressor of NAD biosynthesis genes